MRRCQNITYALTITSNTSPLTEPLYWPRQLCMVSNFIAAYAECGGRSLTRWQTDRRRRPSPNGSIEISPVSRRIGYRRRQCYVPEFLRQSFTKLLSPKLLAGIIFDVYDQHNQIITKLDVKLNKWHITIKKLYRIALKQNKFFFKLWPDSEIEPQT